MNKWFIITLLFIVPDVISSFPMQVLFLLPSGQWDIPNFKPVPLNYTGKPVVADILAFFIYQLFFLILGTESHVLAPTVQRTSYAEIYTFL